MFNTVSPYETQFIRLVGFVALLIILLSLGIIFLCRADIPKAMRLQLWEEVIINGKVGAGTVFCLSACCIFFGAAWFFFLNWRGGGQFGFLFLSGACLILSVIAAAFCVAIQTTNILNAYHRTLQNDWLDRLISIQPVDSIEGEPCRMYGDYLVAHTGKTVRLHFFPDDSEKPCVRKEGVAHRIQSVDSEGK